MYLRQRQAYEHAQQKARQQAQWADAAADVAPRA